jgi:hypothetical protein
MKWQKVVVGYFQIWKWSGRRQLLSFIQIISSHSPPRCKENYRAGKLGALGDDSSRLQIGIISFRDNLFVMMDTDNRIYVKINYTSQRSVKPNNQAIYYQHRGNPACFHVSSPECRAKPQKPFKYFWTTLPNQNNIQEEVHGRTPLYHLVQKTGSSRPSTSSLRSWRLTN